MLLEQEIKDMEESFDEMERYLHVSHERATKDLEISVRSEIEKQKEVATEVENVFLLIPN